MIDVQEWQDLTRNIVSAMGDQATLTALVAKADEAMSAAMAEYADADKERTTLREDNEALRKANMEFFTRLTARETSSTTGTGEEEKTTEAEKITFADLFSKKE